MRGKEHADIFFVGLRNFSPHDRLTAGGKQNFADYSAVFPSVGQRHSVEFVIVCVVNLSVFDDDFFTPFLAEQVSYEIFELPVGEIRRDIPDNIVPLAS